MNLNLKNNLKYRFYPVFNTEINANTIPMFIINYFSTECQSKNCAATCTKATEGAQNSSDSYHKNQNYPNFYD